MLSVETMVPLAMLLSLLCLLAWYALSFIGGFAGGFLGIDSWRLQHSIFTVSRRAMFAGLALMLLSLAAASWIDPPTSYEAAKFLVSFVARLLPLVWLGLVIRSSTWLLRALQEAQGSRRVWMLVGLVVLIITAPIMVMALFGGPIWWMNWYWSPYR